MGVTAILLDTHIFLWWLFDDPKLPERLGRIVSEADVRVWVSAASVWEITTKARLGKLPEAGSVPRNVPSWIQRAGFEPLPITPAHAQLAGSWRMSHRDPFDRMLAAQARIEAIPIASVDPAVKRFPISVIP